MKNVGCIGTGSIGKAIATCLLEKKYSVFLYNRTKSNAKSAIDLGGFWCDSPKNLGEKVDVIFLCLGCEEATSNILWDMKEGIVQSLKSGSTLIDLGTVSPEFAITTSRRLINEWSINYLECPVSGGVQGACEGELAGIVAGNENAYRKCSELLRAITKVLIYVGDEGRAQKLKILNNLVESINLIGAIEVIQEGGRLGLNLEEMSSVFLSCRGRSDYMKVALDYFKSSDKTSGVNLAIRCKDISLAKEIIDIDKNVISNYSIKIFENALKFLGADSDQCDVYQLFSDNTDNIKFRDDLGTTES